jgi:hypothetical protein
MSVGDEQIEAAVVVEVDELHAPPEIRSRRGGDAAGVTAIGEHAGRTVLVECVVIV